MEKIIVQAIDCYRHDYWKVSLDLLDSLNIFDAISEYSYLGNGKELSFKGISIISKIPNGSASLIIGNNNITVSCNQETIIRINNQQITVDTSRQKQIAL